MNKGIKYRTITGTSGFGAQTRRYMLFYDAHTKAYTTKHSQEHHGNLLFPSSRISSARSHHTLEVYVNLIPESESVRRAPRTRGSPKSDHLEACHGTELHKCGGVDVEQDSRLKDEVAGAGLKPHIKHKRERGDLPAGNQAKNRHDLSDAGIVASRMLEGRDQEPVYGGGGGMEEGGNEEGRHQLTWRLEFTVGQ
jgi:hypothetical protein